MQILIAKSAGFCFGVKNAIDKVNLASVDNEVKTYGPIIHNKQVVEDLSRKGVSILDNLEDAKKDLGVVIRSHGVSKSEIKTLEDKGANIIDATCPFVKNIHRIAEKKSNEGYKIIIIGDPSHPEVKGISGWCKESFIVQNIEDVEGVKGGKICIVAQTTFNRVKWKEIVSSLIGVAKETVIFDTICSATDERQSEAREISSKVDAMIVVGGKESSNSRKLFEISKENCENSYFIETEEELNLDSIRGCKVVGITAGASTPDYVIDRVIKKIKSLEIDMNIEKQKEEISDDEFNMYFDMLDSIKVGTKVNATVMSVKERVMYLDISYKSDAIIDINNMPSCGDSFIGKFKSGDVIEAEVVRMNDGEGNVVLSRLSLEKEGQIDKIRVFKESEEEVEVTMLEEVKGGYSGKFNGFKVFMPASLSGTKNREEVLNKKLMVRINEIKEERRDIQIIVSRKEILEEKRQRDVANAFETLEEGKIITGNIKAIIEAGLFINIGAVDVFVPKAEISWFRNINVSKHYKIGDKASAEILRVDKDSKKVSGSMKKLEKQPFETMLEKYKVDDVLEVKVLRFTDFGAFVEVVEGVDGLIHISKISNERVDKVDKALSIGQIVKAKIINIDLDKKKVELSIKDAE
ncbi:MAG: bifunctional 4-hydroxy-3-methylbut-2-enyl diphosphate reductase/30S ribosomal protein S1 [Clostridium sp.]